MTENKRHTHNNCEYYDEGICLRYYNVYVNAWGIDKYNYCLDDMDDFVKRKLVIQNDRKICLDDMEHFIKRGRW